MRNQVVSHEDWLRARLDLLAAEKEFTRQRDVLSRRRRQMPWEKVEKDYRFEGPNGTLSLTDLFEKIELPLGRPDLTGQPVYQGGPVRPDRGFVLHSPMRPSPGKATAVPVDGIGEDENRRQLPRGVVVQVAVGASLEHVIDLADRRTLGGEIERHGVRPTLPHVHTVSWDARASRLVPRAARLSNVRPLRDTIVDIGIIN